VNGGKPECRHYTDMRARLKFLSKLSCIPEVEFFGAFPTEIKDLILEKGETQDQSPSEIAGVVLGTLKCGFHLATIINYKGWSQQEIPTLLEYIALADDEVKLDFLPYYCNPILAGNSLSALANSSSSLGELIKAKWMKRVQIHLRRTSLGPPQYHASNWDSKITLIT
jgi:hypothetical protein